MDDDDSEIRDASKMRLVPSSKQYGLEIVDEDDEIELENIEVND